MSGRKRKILTLEDRVKVIDRVKKGESCRAVALSLDVGKTQIQSIIKDKETIMKEWQEGGNAERKYVKARRLLYDDLDFLSF